MLKILLLYIYWLYYIFKVIPNYDIIKILCLSKLYLRTNNKIENDINENLIDQQKSLNESLISNNFTKDFYIQNNGKNIKPSIKISLEELSMESLNAEHNFLSHKIKQLNTQYQILNSELAGIKSKFHNKEVPDEQKEILYERIDEIKISINSIISNIDKEVSKLLLFYFEIYDRMLLDKKYMNHKYILSCRNNKNKIYELNLKMYKELYSHLCFEWEKSMCYLLPKNIECIKLQDMITIIKQYIE
ncbi:uncharacterized protein CMU_042810 [Cryptosporidium muris RN66]|uniref:Uncharacterized protein n=1 Tax=Cryptosporidium muris (strain RN66) TaxID=441375 RepID=B6AAG6_CRYMR|nr:uncharacterized protein CMU_042810 [Cryptosporidium muris RN66]EEA05207.1 hypothetical protein CMU_042810 [Cryptosporidium muris RN66]|eukprot:XP_002139556.1 hypothetical protein [Cryptosporidium muris RN66]